MQDETDLTPAQRELEAALASLAPARPGIDRDGLLYQAGVFAGRSACRRWAAAATAAAVVLAAALAVVASFPRRPAERIVYVRQAPPARSIPEPWTVEIAPGEAPGADYIRLRSEVLAKGLGALPAAVSGGGPGELNEEYRQMLPPRAEPIFGGLAKLWTFLHTGDES